MVFSVFAGTVAFAGSASAATANNVTVSPNTVAEQTTNDHTITVNATLNSTTPEDTTHNLTVDLPDSLSGVDSISGTPSVDTGGSDFDNARAGDVNVSGNNEVTVQVDTTASGSSSDVDVIVSFDIDGVTAPSVSSDTDADVDLTVDEDIDTAGDTNTATGVETLTIQDTNNPELDSAVHYDDPDNGPGVEVVFTQPVVIGNNGDIAIFEDGSEEANFADATSASTGDTVQRVFVETDDVLTGDLDLVLSENIQSAGTNTPIADDGNNSVTFAPVTLTDGNDVNAYQGGNVSIVSESGTDADVTIEGDDNSYFFEGSTGQSSEVLVFQTEDRELGDYNVTIASGDPLNTQITVRDLGFNSEIEDLNVSTDDTIEVDISANAGNRPVSVDLLDSSGDEINTTEVTTGGNGEATVEFDTSSADETDALDPGDYTVESTDLFSGISVESSEITVSEADDEDAEFTDNVISDQRGDVLEATVELTETDFATLSFGSEEDGVIANASVEDEDGDGQVTVYINTWDFYSGSTSADVFSLDSDSDDTINSQELDTPTNDLVDAGDYDFEVQAQTSEVDVVGANDAVDDSDDVATVTLEERGTEEFRTWTMPNSEGNPSDLEDVSEAIEDGDLAQTSDISNGDIVVHELQVTGFEGLLDARDNEGVEGNFFGSEFNDSNTYNLTVEEASPGANQDAETVELAQNNVTVVADGPNDTYYIAFDTDAVEYYGGGAIEDDTALEANFTVINNDDSDTDFVNEADLDSDEDETTTTQYDVVEPDFTIDTPYNVSQASGQTVSGTTTLAPGTELSLRVRSQDGVSPSFLKTASPDVQSDRTFNATFDFSEQNVGDDYDIIVNGGDAPETEEEGQVVEAVETATATPEPDTDTATAEPGTDTATPDEQDTATPDEQDTQTSMATDTATSTPTSTPGFGVIVALTALLAAALLAVRRES
jgi:PGF-CTERM protein